jgi:hypothetical protein
MYGNSGKTVETQITRPPEPGLPIKNAARVTEMAKSPGTVATRDSKSANLAHAVPHKIGIWEIRA